ncbi:SpoIVB peptidase [Bacillaceae bacterium]
MVIFCVTLLFIQWTPFRQFASIPEEIRLFNGSIQHLPLSLPAVAATTSNPNVVTVNGSQLEPRAPGEANVELKVGGIPLKSVKVDVLPPLKVYPGGQSIGVKLQTAGVLVVGYHLVEQGGKKVSPGKEAGVKVGDLILKMNGLYLNELSEVAKIVEEAGKKGKAIEVEIARGDEKLHMSIRPVYDETEKRHRIGLYIRDSAAGVGTLTFYEPNTKKFGALGHVISDMDTGQPIIVGDGQIVQSSVTSIEKGQSGVPGEKLARFYDEGNILGTITKNSPFGIFGTMKEKLQNGLYDKPIPVALSDQVKEGPAEILTVVDGQKVEKFAIEIVNVIHQRYPATKSMIIKVTDDRLLQKTGGIVQGMSGSPIIQNGKLVGAVTHVFVNDPTQGYGVFIEWMLQDAGIQLYTSSKLKAG